MSGYRKGPGETRSRGTSRPHTETPQVSRQVSAEACAMRERVGRPLAVHAHVMQQTRGGGVREVVVAMRQIATLDELSQARVIAASRKEWRRQWPGCVVEVVS